MMNRRQFLTIAASTATVAALPLPSFAATMSLAEIEAEIAKGGPVLIHVTAPWCGTCKRQKPIVADLLAKPEFKGLRKIDVDFDSQGDVLRKFQVQTQATMLVFKNGKEVDRAVGQTRPEVIAALFKKVA
ncbi:thioredoxin family protein [Mesorhizobium amorphae]|uniref:thioredoxin family protein n=1 Tax=Mesorhizobium amorphae TaxID=71433 RepID=UPI0021B230B8|nr:thioredoxin family protein [Mesorhizobium amorphae]